jgi:hypothetical protein
MPPDDAGHSAQGKRGLSETHHGTRCGMREVFDLLRRVRRKRSVPLLLIGGWAVQAYGYARNTVDVDCLVALKLHAAKNPHRQQKDLADVMALRAANPSILVREVLHDLIQQFGDASFMSKLFPEER